MALTKKQAIVLILVCFIVGAFAFMILQSSQKKEKPVLEFCDEEGHVGTFSDAFVFRDFDLGWNNKTLSVRNIGEKPVRILLIVTSLPVGWCILWSYQGQVIAPEESIDLTISIYATYPIPVKPLMLGIAIRCKELLDDEHTL